MSGADLFIAISLSGHARFQLHSYRGTFAQKVPGELLKLPAPRCRESSRQGKGLFVVVRSLTHAASCGECARYSCSKEDHSMWTKQYRIKLWFLFLTPLLMVLANEARAEEILVKGVPYIVKKAHIA